MPAFLRNVWYMAAWSEEVTRTPIARTILGMPVLLYRDAAGGVVALGDICPHRFAPLSKGRIEDDVIVCPYHGLGFSPQGKCVQVPFEGAAPGALATPVFPVAERDAMIWLWPGDAALSGDAVVPEHPEMRPQAGIVATGGGYLHVKGDYRLVADNLLDLSHAEFLHPYLGNPGSVSRTSFTASEQDGHVVASSLITNDPATGLIRMMWEGDVPEHIDMRIDLHWDAPANMRLDLVVTAHGGDSDRAFVSRQPHIVTPETGTSCHYFFGNSRNMKIDVEAMTHGMAAAMKATFENEDVPMIEAQQSYRAMAEARGMKMGMLRLDEGVVRANRHLDRLIAQEGAALG